MLIWRSWGERNRTNFPLFPHFHVKSESVKQEVIQEVIQPTFLRFSSPTFYTEKIYARKDEVIYKGEKSVRKRTRTVIYVLQISGPVFLPLRKNNSRRKTFMNTTKS